MPSDSVPPLVLILGSLRCHDRYSNEKCQKSNRCRLTKQRSRSFVHFFTIAARLLMNKPHFTFYGGRKQVTEIFFLSLNVDMVVRNSNPEEFAWIWKSKWIGKIMMEFERTQIWHFHGRHGIFNSLLFFGGKERNLATNKHNTTQCLASK